MYIFIFGMSVAAVTNMFESVGCSRTRLLVGWRVGVRVLKAVKQTNPRPDPPVNRQAALPTYS